MIRRRWFQLHFSTTLLLLFVASVLLGLNLLPQQDDLGRIRYGWPEDVHTFGNLAGYTLYHTPFLGDTKWNWPGILRNSALALALLVVIAVLVESAIRYSSKKSTKEFQP